MLLTLSYLGNFIRKGCVCFFFFFFFFFFFLPFLVNLVGEFVFDILAFLGNFIREGCVFYCDLS